jgi:hypothetical protein
MGLPAILSGHKQATRARLQAQEGVLLGQDPTFLADGTRRPKAGMGTVKVKGRQEDLRHPPVAFPPERVNGGVLGAKLWQHPKPPVGRERKRQPIEAKASDRWLAGEALACEVQPSGPAPLGVHVADRAGDIHAWLREARPRPPDSRTDFLLRAKGNRRVATSKAPGYVWEARRQARPLGRLPLALARPPERPPRQLPLTGRAKRVTFTQARRQGGKLPSVDVAAGYAKEGRPPQGPEPLAWLWRTSLPGTDFSRACVGVQGSRCRWELALCCRVFTPGCQIEPLRLQTDQRWLHALALYLLIA